MTPAGRTRLRELAETATPGPWRTEYLLGRGNDLLTAILSGPVAAPRVVGSLLREQDGRYVAAVPPDVVLALLDALDAAEADRDRLAAAIERVRADLADIATDIANDSGDDAATYGVEYYAGMITAASRIIRVIRALDGGE